MNNIEYKVKKIISNQFNISINNLLFNTSIKNDLKADSLDIIELIISIEEEFNIEILDEDIEKFDNINSIINYIYKKI